VADIRIVVFDRLDTYLFDIDPTQVMDATYVDAINGEHSVTITTAQELSKTDRLVIRDRMGVWHEYVVYGIVETHDAREYYCIWSLQYDLMGTFIDNQYGCGIVPGHASVPQTPRKGLECALEGTTRWAIGTITVTTAAAASFYRRSGWEGIKTVLEMWGGELSATITVGQEGVIGRAVNLLTHVGTANATRRFDYGHDVTEIKRTVDDEVWPCRIVPLGKSQATENGGYTRRPDIAEVNGGVKWLQDDEVVPYTRIPAPNGTWEYPTVIIENNTYEEPADIKAWALEHISEYTRPKVSYEASVVQLTQAGMNPHGVALGDNVAVVDRTFCEGGLRITARVVKVVGNLLDASDTKLAIGNALESLSASFGGMSRRISEVSDVLANSQQYMSTAEYVSNLIGRINGEANATGGYTYITEGEGMRTYDRPVSDPLVGAEATQVVEIKGGNIRIANSRTAAGDWDWKTVLVSGHIAAELITAVRIVSGMIGNVSGSYWDLDQNELVIASGATIGDRSVSDVLDDVDATISGVDVEFASNQDRTTAPQTGWSTTAPAWQSGWYIWQRTATTTPEGVTYSAPTCISGRDGDGVTVTSIEYGTSQSAATAPQTWSTTAPTSIAQGLWLWVRTNYNNGDSTVTKSYIGTDGSDGASVYVQSSTKSGGTTTVVLSDGTTSTTLTIVDGEDGDDGTNGLNGYVHVAWANSADGSTDFSTSVSAGKTYIGVYTDNTQADSQTYSDYSWSLIKGADGTDGEDGIGITSVVEEYYLSSSNTTQTGGSWSTDQPVWQSGYYIWTRSKITWDTTPATTTTTTPVLAKAINGANATAKQASDDASDAAKTATNYLTYSSSSGLTVGYSGTSAKTRINGSGVTVYNGSGTDVASFGSTVRIGQSGGERITVSSSSIDMYNSSNESMASIGSSSIRLGKSSAQRAALSTTSFDLYDSNNVSYASLGSTFRLGKSNGAHLSMSSSSFSFYNSSNTAIATFSTYGSYGKLDTYQVDCHSLNAGSVNVTSGMRVGAASYGDSFTVLAVGTDTVSFSNSTVATLFTGTYVKNYIVGSGVAYDKLAVFISNGDYNAYSGWIVGSVDESCNVRAHVASAYTGTVRCDYIIVRLA
jgi:phage minor structural protein